ncbi:ImmA/IrrE family metallo-endopeptidase [Paenibacillus sp. HN-1]|uniref:ImmA/IrrE family metallo-endopeptidase n=1 Tax=Paenibacillus TaxID=44249 RepID=UPI001CA92454|nr:MULTISPECIES: ImmA/IrrE family metallo-endopeptidase [Paenibacillus]MBY9081058.1 ImmA/IrrE family metallo-endopeptidase [Paenibacillus sp. CGMCC 1.18879]MBY9087095.1 ImmA/IrrE family metallo-endopeptidase [Paenibacillus sinensis]
MHLSKYFKTPLEQTVEDHYRSLGIVNPIDLSAEDVAQAFGVEVYFKNIKSFSDNELSVIVLNDQDDIYKQRIAFFHELGHVLRHAGDQRRMPELFRQMQEADAERFCLYAAIPFFILESIPLPAAEEEAAGHLAKIFQVPPEFALQRLRQIQERISSAEFITATFTYPAPAREECIPLPTAEPVIRGIYGLEDLSRPHTLVIEQRGGFDWESPLYIEVDGCFRSVDSQPYSYRDGAMVRSGDLKLPRDRSGYVTIDMGRIASRHGQTANRLFLPMEALDDAINF